MPPTGIKIEDLVTTMGWCDGKMIEEKTVTVLQVVFCS